MNANKDKIVRFEDDWDQAGFVALPNPILFSGLSDGAVRVYAALAHHARKKDTCWPGQARLAAMIGISEARIRARLRELVDAGLLEVQRLGQGRTNRYTLKHRSRPFKNGGLEPPVSNDKVDKGEVDEGSKEPSYRRGEVEVVWNHFLSAFKPRRKEPDSGQQKIIEGALKVASVDELKQALDAAAASDWHQKRGAHSTRAGKKHNTLTAILKPKQASAQGPGYTQRERIDFWLDRSEAPTADREQIIEAWVEARNAYARGEGPDPGASPWEDA